MPLSQNAQTNLDDFMTGISDQNLVEATEKLSKEKQEIIFGNDNYVYLSYEEEKTFQVFIYGLPIDKLQIIWNSDSYVFDLLREKGETFQESISSLSIEQLKIIFDLKTKNIVTIEDEYTISRLEKLPPEQLEHICSLKREPLSLNRTSSDEILYICEKYKEHYKIILSIILKTNIVGTFSYKKERSDILDKIANLCSNDGPGKIKIFIRNYNIITEKEIFKGNYVSFEQLKNLTEEEAKFLNDNYFKCLASLNKSANITSADILEKFRNNATKEAIIKIIESQDTPIFLIVSKGEVTLDLILESYRREPEKTLNVMAWKEKGMGIEALPWMKENPEQYSNKESNNGVRTIPKLTMLY